MNFGILKSLAKSARKVIITKVGMCVDHCIALTALNVDGMAWVFSISVFLHFLFITNNNKI